MTKQSPWQALYGANAELLSDIRKWLDYTQEQLAVILNCTHRTYWLWEHGDVYPSEEIWQKLLELVKKEAKRRFRDEFIKHLCGAAGLTPYIDKGNNQFRPKTEKEILVELETKKEYVEYLMNNVFAKKSAELKNLPFRTAFAKYCRDEMDITPRTLLNRFPAPADVRKIREERRKRRTATTPRSSNNQATAIRPKEAKRQKRRRAEKTTSGSGGSEGSEGGPEPPGLGFAVPEAGVKEFIDLYHRKYGVVLEEKEAYRRFSELLILFTILLQEG